jgi:predicted ABC-type transport system involved in lysophospholipase L1 biosynthesis ATPase subunit
LPVSLQCNLIPGIAWVQTAAAEVSMPGFALLAALLEWLGSRAGWAPMRCNCSAANNIALRSRALANHPAMLFADELTALHDSARGRELRSLGFSPDLEFDR